MVSYLNRHSIPNLNFLRLMISDNDFTSLSFRRFFSEQKGTDTVRIHTMCSCIPVCSTPVEVRTGN